MKSGFIRAALIALAVAVPIATVACGPDGRSVGDSCPDLPLYRYVYDPDTKTWSRLQVGPDDAAAPLTDAQVSAISEAEQNCTTKAGNANTLSPVSGDASTSGAGGASRDAGTD